MTKCAATTKSGKPCKNNAREGSAYCGVHAYLEVKKAAEAAPQVETSEAAAVEAQQSEANAIEAALGELTQRVEEIKNKSPKNHGRCA